MYLARHAARSLTDHRTADSNDTQKTTQRLRMVSQWRTSMATNSQILIIPSTATAPPSPQPPLHDPRIMHRRNTLYVYMYPCRHYPQSHLLFPVKRTLTYPPTQAHPSTHPPSIRHRRPRRLHSRVPNCIPNPRNSPHVLTSLPSSSSAAFNLTFNVHCTPRSPHPPRIDPVSVLLLRLLRPDSLSHLLLLHTQTLVPHTYAEHRFPAGGSPPSKF